MPAFVAVLILINQLPELGRGDGRNMLLFFLAFPALTAGIIAIGFKPGRDGLRRTALVLCYISAVLTGGVAVFSAVLAVTALGKDRSGPWSGVLTAILTAVALVGLFFAVVNGLAVRMLRSRPAQDWFAGEHPPGPETRDWRPRRALPVLMVVGGIGGIVFIVVHANLTRAGAALNSESLGAYASICTGILTVPLLLGAAAKVRPVAIVAASFGAFVWSLLTLLGLTGGPGLLGLVSLVFTAAHVAMIVLLTRAEPLPAHDDASR